MTALSSKDIKITGTDSSLVRTGADSFTESSKAATERTGGGNILISIRRKTRAFYRKLRWNHKRFLHDPNPFFEEERGLKKAAEKVVEDQDKVTIVGGGHGDSASGLAERFDLEKLNIFEPSKENCAEIRQKLSGFKDLDFEVTESAVGKIYYTHADQEPENIPADKLEHSDVLELDCEGSEHSIISNLQYDPRAIIVEVHPWRFEETTSEFLNLLSEKGYEITDRYGHDGADLDTEGFRKLLEKSAELGEKFSETGARWPVVISAVKTGGEDT